MGKESAAIHLYVPICPNCGGALKYYEGTHNFFCHCCKSSWGIKDNGQTDRELICERRDENADD